MFLDDPPTVAVSEAQLDPQPHDVRLNFLQRWPQVGGDLGGRLQFVDPGDDASQFIGRVPLKAMSTRCFTPGVTRPLATSSR